MARTSRDLRAVGITGGIGCGKSEVARILRAMGIPVLDADDVARDVVRPGGKVLPRIASRFGAEIVKPDGALDRARLGRIVFADPQALADLNALVHPSVRTLMRSWVAEQLGMGRSCAGVIPLLFETGGEAAWDAVLCVASRDEVALPRLRARGWSDEEIFRRRATQWPLEEKRKRADIVIENDGTIEELAARVREAWQEILVKESRHGR